MKPLVICKSCGYVMGKERLLDRCPACGVPAKMFADYTDTVSASRRRWLSLDIHPILVHFPQAFTVSLLILGCAAFIIKGVWLDRISGAIMVLGAALPLAVFLTFLGGLADGKIRFRRVTTPLLLKKMVLTAFFFLFALGIMALVLNRPLTAPETLYRLLGLAASALLCGSLLGIIGTRILNSKFPG